MKDYLAVFHSLDSGKDADAISAVSANSFLKKPNGTIGAIGTSMDYAEMTRRGATAYAASLEAQKAEHAAMLADVERTLAAIKAQRARGAVTLRDGRVMHSWLAAGPIGNIGLAIASLDVARRQDAVVLAAGNTLHLVEPSGGISSALIADLRRQAATIVAVLSGEDKNLMIDLSMGDAFEEGGNG